MKFKGKYKRAVNNFTNCEILIEYGKLQRVNFNSRQFFNDANPKDKINFELEKISSEPIEFIPVQSNYSLNYIGQHNEPIKIYLKLNILQKVKYCFHRYYYSEKAKVFLTDIIKLLIGAFLGVLGTLYVQSDNKKKETTPELKNEIKIGNNNGQTTDKDLKADSIINNKSNK